MAGTDGSNAHAYITSVAIRAGSAAFVQANGVLNLYRVDVLQRDAARTCRCATSHMIHTQLVCKPQLLALASWSLVCPASDAFLRSRWAYVLSCCLCMPAV
jgi:hypothetical protein